MKIEKKKEAIALRKQGKSLLEIADALGVAKSSASLWVRHVDVDVDFKKRSVATRRSLGSYQRIARAAGERARQNRLRAQKLGISEIENSGFSLFSIGCMLYWCEGHKSKNVIEFSNSDPSVIAIFVRFLRESLGVDENKIRVRIHAYLNNGITQHDIEDHWLRVTALDRSKLYRGTYDKYSKSSSMKKRNLPYGTAYISVCDTEKLHMIYGGIASVCGEPHKFLF